MKMEAKEVKKWQDEEALKRYGMIAPLLDPELDGGKRRQMRANLIHPFSVIDVEY